MKMSIDNQRYIVRELLEAEIMQFSEISRCLVDKDWVVGNLGSISSNVTNLMFHDFEYFDSPSLANPYSLNYLAKKSFIINCSNTRIRDIANKPIKNICYIIFDNSASHYKVLTLADSNPIQKPTDEFAIHLAIHQKLIIEKSNDKVVLQVYPTHLMSLSIIKDISDEVSFNKIIRSMFPEITRKVPDGIGLIPYSEAESLNIIENILNEFARKSIVIFQKKYCLSTGSNLSNAYDKIDFANKSAQIYINCKSIGLQFE